MKDFVGTFLALAGALWVAGCGDGGASAPEPAPSAAEAPRVVTLTNVVVREVFATNVVSVTNVVWERREKPSTLSLRKTAPYLVSSVSMRGAELRKYLQATGARILTCDPGAVALVEAPEGVVKTLKAGGALNVHRLAADEKLAAGLGPEVRVVPMSFLDCSAVADAIRALGGEVVAVVTTGQPQVRAKISKEMLKELASRGDVRRIERGEDK